MFRIGGDGNLATYTYIYDSYTLIFAFFHDIMMEVKYHTTKES